jgi:DNA-binding MurR/RpiR family transcriptional regulator
MTSTSSSPNAEGRQAAPPTVRDMLVASRGCLTGSELKVMRRLLANYPAAGLGTVVRLARDSGVSDPTVVRFVTKLGFSGYPEFQQCLLSEVEAHMASPLTMFERQSDFRGDPCRAAMAAAGDAILTDVSHGVYSDTSGATTLIANRKARVFCLGGRFSRHLAAILHAHLVQLRPGVHLIDGSASDLSDALIDLGRRDVLVVFDYRRWQTDIVGFADQAAARGVQIVLFTDPWLSPIAKVAKVVMASSVQSSSPFDTMAPALALVEGLVAAMTAKLDAQAKARISIFEQFRSANRITLEGPDDRPQEPTRRRIRRRG